MPGWIPWRTVPSGSMSTGWRQSLSDPEAYEAEEGKTVMASNLLVCIDPGHYSGQEHGGERNRPMRKGISPCSLPRNFREVLKEDYGVTSILTRDSGKYFSRRVYR